LSDRPSNAELLPLTRYLPQSY